MLSDFSIEMMKARRRQCIEQIGDKVKELKKCKYETEFYSQWKYNLHWKKNIFQELKKEKRKKQWNLLLPGVHYRKSKSDSGKSKIIPDENMEMQEKIKNTGQNKYVGKYKVTLILQNNSCNIW